MPTDTVILEPVIQRFVDALAATGEPPVYTLSPADARATLTSAQSVPIGKPNARMEDATFPVGPKGSLRVRIVRPNDDKKILPVVMYFHGGGWVLGDANTSRDWKEK